jgi:hypothetical protein
MTRKRITLGLGAAALALLVYGDVGRADGPVMVGPGGPCCAAEGCCAPGGCCAAEGCCKTCVPTPTEKKVVLRHYGEKCEDFCVCKPTCLGGLFNLHEGLQKDYDRYIGRGPGDQPCDEGGGCGCGKACGNPHVKKFLVIHSRVHTECEMTCQIPGQGPAEGIVVASPGQYPGPRTPGLNPNRGVIVAPSGPTVVPQAAPSERPRPLTPGLSPGR